MEGAFKIKLIDIAKRAAIGFLFLLSPSLHAYSNFIGYGYTSCSTCHYNPLGNGPLTDYGRALGATTIAERPPFLNPKITDEELGERSDFTAGFQKLPSWLRPSINYRSLFYVRDLPNERVFRQIHMRADGTLTLKFLKDKLIATGTFGYAPIPSNVSRERRGNTSELITREHYIAYRHNKNIGFYAGLMDIAYGLRIPDHTAYSRSATALAQNDQSHGLMIHGATKKWEGAVHALLGNYTQAADLRPMGGSATAEYEIDEKFRLGASVMGTTNDYRKRFLGELHTRVGIGESGHSLLFETGFIRESPEATASSLGHYALMQNMLRMRRGLHLLFTGEYYTTKAIESASRYWRMTPGLQYFPAQRLELRAELQMTRITGASTVSRDSIGLVTQLSLWF